MSDLLTFGSEVAISKLSLEEAEDVLALVDIAAERRDHMLAHALFATAQKYPDYRLAEVHRDSRVSPLGEVCLGYRFSIYKHDEEVRA